MLTFLRAVPPAAAAVTLLMLGLALADPGDLNQQFSGDGKVSTDLLHASATAEAFAEQPDGKLLIGGYAGGNYALARLNPDGTFDAGFADGGRGLYDFDDPFNEYLYDLLVLDNGKILGSGRAATGLAVIRWNANGTVDTSFGMNGQAIFNGTGQAIDGYGVAVQSDGKVIAVGRTNPGTVLGGFAMARFNANGTLDTNFGTNGGVVNGSDEGPRDVLVQPDDKIITVGGTHSFNATGDVVIQRWTASGAPDSTFGAGGRVEQDFGGDFDRALAVALDGDKVLVGGQTKRFTIDWLVARFGMDGALDTSFAGDGSYEHDFSGGNDAATALDVFDGRIAAGGYTTGAFAVGVLMNTGTPDSGFSGDGLLTTSGGGGLGFHIVADITVRENETVVIGGGDGTMGVVAYNPDGTFDATFGDNGFTAVPMPGSRDSAVAILELSGGKLLAAGPAGNEAGFVRYNANGSLDSSFGDSGRVIHNFVAGSIESVTGAALQADGKALVTGRTNSGATFVARLNPDGSLDLSFADDGTFDTSGALEAVAVQEDGKVVAAGQTLAGDFLVVRLTAAGTPDAGFSGDGMVATDILAGGTDWARAVLASGDKIVAAGSGTTGAGNSVMAAVRYNADGTLDSGFGGDGKVTVTFGDDSGVSDVAMLPGGGYVLAGVNENSDNELALAVLKDFGELDPAFDGDGKLTYQPDAAAQEWTAVAVQPDGKLVVGGNIFETIDAADMAVARFSADGALDAAFGDAGLVTVDFVGLDDQLADLFIRDDTTIVAAGYANSALTGRDFAVVQVEGDQPPQPPGEERVWGDNNCTAAPPDAIDSLITLRFNAGLSASTGECPGMGQVVEVALASPHLWGDVDCSGGVTAVDALKVLRFVASLEVSQPPGCPDLGATVLVSE